MSNARVQLRELVTADIVQRYPENTDKTEAIINRLLDMPAMQSDDNVIKFIDSYRRAVEKRDNGLLGQTGSS